MTAQQERVNIKFMNKLLLSSTFLLLFSCVSNPQQNDYHSTSIGFIESQEYFNKEIPLRIKFPRKVYVRELNKLYSHAQNKNRKLFRVFKYHLGLGKLMNPQFDCYSYPVSDFGKSKLSPEEFMQTIDKKQKSFGNKVLKYTPVNSQNSKSGLKLKTRSSQINHENYKIIVKQFFTNIKNNVIFCAGTYEEDSLKDIDFFNKVIEGFSSKINDK